MLMRSGISGNPPAGRSPLRLSLSRRRVFTLGAVVTLSAGLSGCTPAPVTGQLPPEPEELSVNRAVEAARALRTHALALAGTRPELAGLLRRTAAVHEQHLVALGSPITAASSPASAAASAAADPPEAGPAPVRTPAQLIKAEIGAARTALRDGEAAAPVFAVLLCRIAAARIVHADLLSAATARTPPGALRPARPTSATGPATNSSPATASTPAGPATPEPDPLETDPPDPADLTPPGTPARIALDRLLAGKHAAVFAYPLIIARAATGRHALASALWQAHRTERDELSSRLLSAGVRPAVAEPAYDVGTLPTSSAKAASLAARVEGGLAALAADLLAAGTAGDDDRVLGAAQLVLAARRTAGWTGRPTAFPGLLPRATATGTTDPAGAITPTDLTSPIDPTSPTDPTSPIDPTSPTGTIAPTELNGTTATSLTGTTPSSTPGATPTTPV